MAKKRRVASHHAVGPSLDPKSMQGYIQDWYDEQGQRQGAADQLQDVTLGDPAARAAIALNYVRGKESKTASLASRGLSAGGYGAGDLADLERTRVAAEEAQNMKIRTAEANFTSTIQRLNNRRTALDKSFAAEAGQNIQAGTGRYAHEKPRGWRPPSLAGGVTAPGATYGTPKPAAPVAQPPRGELPPQPGTPPRAPTGGRLVTSAPRTLGMIHSAPRLAPDRGRKRIRLG